MAEDISATAGAASEGTVDEPNALRISDLTPKVCSLLSILLFSLLAVYFTTSIHEPAFYWHLSLGSWILDERLLPTTNHFTYAGEQLEFYSLSWLFDTVVAALFDRYGFLGVLCCKIVFVSVLLGVLVRSFIHYSGSVFSTGIIISLVGAGLLVRSQLTAELFGFIFFTLVCDWILFVRSGRAAFGYVLAIFPLSVFAANMNLKAVVASSIVVCLSVLVSSGEVGEQRRIAQQTVLLFVLLVLSSLLTPYQAEDLLFVLHSLFAYLTSEVLVGADIGDITEYPIALLILCSVALFAVAHGGSNVVSVGQRLLLVFLLIISCVARSCAPYALIASGFIVAQVLGQGLAKLGPIGIGLQLLGNKLSRLPAFASMFFLASLLFVTTASLVKRPQSALLLPKRELEFYFEQDFWQENFPLYHTPELGGYVMWKLRYSRFGRASAATAVMTAYPGLADLEKRMENLDQGWRYYFYSLLAPRSALVKRGSALGRYLQNDESWCEVQAEGWDWRLFFKKPVCPEIQQTLYP